MESGVKRSQRDYTLAFKLRVVDQVEKGELTYKEAQKFYGIQGRSTVLVWLRVEAATIVQRLLTKQLTLEAVVQAALAEPRVQAALAGSSR